MFKNLLDKYMSENNVKAYARVYFCMITLRLARFLLTVIGLIYLLSEFTK